MPRTTVTEDLDLPDGDPPPPIEVTYELVGPGGRHLGEGYTTPEGHTIILKTQVTPNGSGQTTIDLWGNDAILPGGTRWARRITRNNEPPTVAYLEVPTTGGPYRVDQVLDDAPGELAIQKWVPLPDEEGEPGQFLAIASIGPLVTEWVDPPEGGGGGSPPAVPTGLTAIAGDGQVALEWDAVAGATSYSYRRDGGSPVSAGGSTDALVTGLTNGVEYDFEVRATNAFGSSAWSAIESATPSATPSYERVDPYLVYSGKIGDRDDELGMDRVDDSARLALITYSTTGGPDGAGGWHFVGADVGGDCDRATDGNSYPVAAPETWCQMRVKFTGFPTGIERICIMLAVVSGDGNVVAALKPCLKIDGSGQLYIGATSGTDEDVPLGDPIELNTVYTPILHCKGGAPGDLDQEAFLYDASGNLIDSVATAWAVGGTSGSGGGVAKWGETGDLDSTGLVFDFAEMVVYRNISTNPGPCRVYTLRPSSVIGAGNWTVVGAADAVAAVTENQSAARAITDLESTAGTSTVISTTSANFAQADVGARFANHAGVPASRIVTFVTDTDFAIVDSTSGVATAGPSSATIQRRGHNGDTSYVVTTSATPSSLEYGLTNPSIPSDYQIHSVIPIITSRHVSGTPTIQIGVKSGAVTKLCDEFPNSTGAYVPRRAADSGSPAASDPAISLDPNTGDRWEPAAIDAMSLVIRDNDSLTRECRVTNAHVDVVAAQIP